MFPTVTGSVVSDADAVVDYVDRERVPDSETGLVVETTEYETTLDTRVRWTRAIVRKVLERHGFGRNPETGSNRSTPEHE